MNTSSNESLDCDNGIYRGNVVDCVISTVSVHEKDQASVSGVPFWDESDSEFSG